MAGNWTVQEYNKLLADLERLGLSKSITKMTVNPKDVIVVKTYRKITEADEKQIREQIRRILPDNEVLILNAHFELGLLPG